MLCTITHCYQLFGSKEDGFKKFYTIYGHSGHAPWMMLSAALHWYDSIIILIILFEIFLLIDYICEHVNSHNLGSKVSLDLSYSDDIMASIYWSYVYLYICYNLLATSRKYLIKRAYTAFSHIIALLPVSLNDGFNSATSLFIVRRTVDGWNRKRKLSNFLQTWKISISNVIITLQQELWLTTNRLSPHPPPCN